MKKILLSLAIALGLSLGISAAARNNYSHDASVLPEAAKQVISKNFKAGVSVVKIDKDLGRISEYEVILTDGTEITFDRHGNWDNVEVNNSKTVPPSLVPTAIQTFVKKNFAGQRIVGLDKERNGYEVELSNGVDIKFDKQGQFVRYDD